jgi:hypothetical protein
LQAVLAELFKRLVKYRAGGTLSRGAGLEAEEMGLGGMTGRYASQDTQEGLLGGRFQDLDM